MKVLGKNLWWYFFTFATVLGLVSCMEEKTMSLNSPKVEF